MGQNIIFIERTSKRLVNEEILPSEWKEWKDSDVLYYLRDKEIIMKNKEKDY